MLWKNNHERYGCITQCLHALIAILVISLLCMGAWMIGLEKSAPIKGYIYNLHKLTGMVVLLTSIAFLGWKILNIKPGWPQNMPRWEQIAATASHHSLLLIVFLMPLSGWLMSTAKGHSPKLMDKAIPMPFVPHSKAIGNFAQTTHYVLAWLFVSLIAIHIAAALKHYFYDKDNILRRMWFS